MSRQAIVIAAVLTAAASLAGAGLADSTPIGPLPRGPVQTITAAKGSLVAVGLPRQSASSGLVWRQARAADATVLRQLSEADVGQSVVVVFKAVGRGKASVVFALTRGDSGTKALKAITYWVRVH